MALYHSAPDRIQPLAKKAYHILHPNQSYLKRIRERERAEAISDEYLGRFLNSNKESNINPAEPINPDELFDKKGRYEQYETEFQSGPLYDIIGQAMGEVNGENWIMDCHKGPCKIYYTLLREFKPDVVVETGVHNGISTLVTLLALSKNGEGQLYSIDNPDAHSTCETDENPNTDWKTVVDSGGPHERARPSSAEIGSSYIPEKKSVGWIVPTEYRNNWKLISGDPRKELPRLVNEIQAIDFFFHDSEHSATEMAFEFELSWHNLADGGFICSHHIGWNNTYSNFVSNRECDHGLLTYHMPEGSERPLPSSTAYVRKPK